MLPFWDVISIAFLGGILVLKRVRDRLRAVDQVQWPMPLSPHPQTKAHQEKSSAERFEHFVLERRAPQETIASASETPDEGELTVREPAGEPPKCELSWLNVELADLHEKPSPETEAPVAACAGNVGFHVEALHNLTELHADVPVREPVVRPTSNDERQAETSAETLSSCPLPVQERGTDPEPGGAERDDNSSLEQRIKVLEQEIQITDHELKQFSAPTCEAPAKAKPDKPASRKKRGKSAARTKARDLVPMVAWVRPESPRPDCSLPIPGVPGEFTADQVLGLVKRLWENRESARPEVREQVEEFLPRVVPSLVKVAQSPSIPESVRYDAVQLLGNVQIPEALPLLTSLVGDPLPSLRYAATTALANFGADQTVAPLLTALGDANYLIRASAAQALGKHCPTPALPALVRSLGDTSRMVRLSARDSIKKYPQEELATRVPFLLPRAPTPAVARVLQIIASLHEDARVPLFRDLLKTEDPRVLKRVVQTVMKMAEPHLADELVDAVTRLEVMEGSLHTDVQSPPVPDDVHPAAGSRAESPASALMQTETSPMTPVLATQAWVVTESISHVVAVTMVGHESAALKVTDLGAEPKNQNAHPSVKAPTPVVEPRGAESEPPAHTSAHAEGSLAKKTDSAPDDNLISYMEQFRISTAFDQMRQLRHLLETRALSFEHLVELYGHAAGAFIRAGILDAMRSFGSYAEPYLLLRLKESEEETLLAAIKALADVGTALAVDSLSGFRRHASPHVRFTTEIALEKIRSRQGKA